MKEYSPFFIFRAQCRATYRFEGHENESSRRHNWFCVVLLIGVPILAAIVTILLFYLPVWFPKAKLPHINMLNIGDPLLASLAILAGALITAFSLLASWRSLVVSKNGDGRDFAAERWLLDTSSAHLLSGAYTSIIASIVIILNKAVAIFNNTICELIGGSLAIALSAHVAMSLIIALPGLYAAYAQLNDVDPVLNGQNDL